MTFINIEGDNGTGKDTLALSLSKYGYEILNYDINLKKYYKYCKRFIGKKRVLHFLEYDERCNKLLLKNSNKNVIVIRYWISTLAAAYADNIYDYNYVIKKAKSLYHRLTKPDVIIRLLCDYDLRVKRIEERNPHSDDDKTYLRDKRYFWIVNKIAESLHLKIIDINTSNKSINEVLEEVKKILRLEKNMEIEKKYKVKSMPNIDVLEKEEIEQGYLCIKPTVRIRKSNDDYFLNYKWKNKNIADIDAIHNIEYEMPLTMENYNHLRSKIDNYLIKKTRYIFNYDNKKIEIDVFHGNLEGLVFAEIEFASDEEAKNFIKPEWLGNDITLDKKYDNTYLSKLDHYSKNEF